MKAIQILCIVSLVVLALWLSPVLAQGTVLLPPSNVVGPYSAYFPANQTGFAVSNGSTTATASGVSVSASGIATAVKNGVHIKIPVSLNTLVTKPNVAIAAGRAFKLARGLAGPVGLALTAWEIYNVVKDSGLTPCAAPDYLCSTAAGTPVAPVSGWYYSTARPGVPYNSPEAACEGQYNARSSGDDWGGGYFISITSSGTAGCASLQPRAYRSEIVSANVVCPPGATMDVKLGCITGAGGSGPASDTEIDAKLNAALAHPTTGAATAKRAWDAAEAVNDIARANGKFGVPVDVMMPPTSQTTMNAPPVSTPQTTTSIQNYNDASGVPQTKTTQEKTTITPEQVGTSTSTSITYNMQNVTTTTVTNNTGQSTSNPPTTTTTTENSSLNVPPVVPATTNLPTDYNREPTQQAIAADIKAMRNACQDNPRRAGCAELDVPPAADIIPRQNVPVSYTPVSFASSASCPAPITFDMYGPRLITFTPMCDLMTKLRPLFLACAAAGAALIFMQGLKS